jgi:hypothetical protein
MTLFASSIRPMQRKSCGDGKFFGLVRALVACQRLLIQRPRTGTDRTRRFRQTRPERWRHLERAMDNRLLVPPRFPFLIADTGALRLKLFDLLECPSDFGRDVNLR